MIRILFKFCKKLIILFLLLSIFGVIIYRYLPVYFTPLMAIRTVEKIRSKKSPKLLHNWVNYNDISDHCKRAVIASEDQLFYEHNGFDKAQIKKALKENKTRKRPRGASTISQQTAKNVFLWPQPSWFRKLNL